MSPAKKQDQDQAPQQLPQTTPQIGYGHPEYQFVQSIMEMQKSIGEVKASVDNIAKSVDSTQKKVDDLVKWKNMIFGGAIVIGVFCTVIGFLVSKAGDYFTISLKDREQTSQPSYVLPESSPAVINPSPKSSAPKK